MTSDGADEPVTTAAPPLGDALGPIDAAFHAGYAEARDVAAQDGPVLVLLGDVLTLVSGDGRVASTDDISPDLFHALKAIAHLPVAIFVALQRGAERSRLDLLRARAVQASADLHTLAAGREDAETIVRASIEILDALTGHERDDDPRLIAFATTLGDPLLRSIREATRVQLAALDHAVSRVMDGLGDRERDALHVVVAGVHQARTRSLGMQYFRRRFAEPDAREARVTYAEAVDSVEDAVRLVGVQRLDRAMAAAFFGDAERLQRDVLGDAAEAILDEASPDDASPSGGRARAGRPETGP